MKRSFWILLLLSVLSPLCWGASSASVLSNKTITLQMLEIANDRAKAVTYPSYNVSFTAYGSSYSYKFLTRVSYAKYFTSTHGSNLTGIAGVDLGFCMQPDSLVFLIYNAFLVLMIGFSWFRKLNEVAKGKGQLEVIPFIGKLAVGLIVSYNIPFVYSMAMNLKDVGLLIVTSAMSGNSNVAANVEAASADTIQTLSIRDQAIRDGLAEASSTLFPPITTGNALDSGRLRIAVLTAALNQQIFKLNGKIQAYEYSNTGTSVNVLYQLDEARCFRGEACYNAITATETGYAPVGYVGFGDNKVKDASATAKTVLHNPNFPADIWDRLTLDLAQANADATADPPKITFPITRMSSGGSVADDSAVKEDNTPLFFTLFSAGKVAVTTSGASGTSSKYPYANLYDSVAAVKSCASSGLGDGNYGSLLRGYAGSPAYVLASCAVDVASAEWLRDRLQQRLLDYLRFSGRTYANYDSKSMGSSSHLLLGLAANRGVVYMPNSDIVPLDTATSSADTRNSDGTITAFTGLSTFVKTAFGNPSFTFPDSTSVWAAYWDPLFDTYKMDFLGDKLLKADMIYAASPKDEAAQQVYRDTIKSETARYVIKGVFGKNILNTTKPTGYNDQSSVSDSSGSILGILANIPRMIAELFMAVLKSFWVPMIARLADFVFNIMIEFYVYLLWLAYPFWFHEKTSKAFTGALNTLIATSCTAATFSLLALMFEGFAGNMMRNVVGSAGMGIAGALSLLSGPGFVVGVGIGFCIFYMIGTFKCFTLAPKIFQAFLSGANVVTPMLMAAATAVAGGVLGGALAGVGVAGMAGSSSLGKAIGSKVTAATSKMGAMAGKIPGAGAVRSGINNMGAKLKAAAEKGKGGKGGIGNAIAADLVKAKRTATAAMKHPAQALGKFTKSKIGMAMGVAAAGMVGDPAKVVEMAGAGFVAQKIFSNQGRNDAKAGAVNPASQNTQDKSTSTAKQEEKPKEVLASSGLAGTHGEVLSTKKVRQPVEIEQDVKVLNNIDNPAFAADVSKLSAAHGGAGPRKIKQNLQVEIETAMETVQKDPNISAADKSSQLNHYKTLLDKTSKGNA